MKCTYECGEEATFTLKNGKPCCQPTHNKCPMIRAKNSAGLKKAHADGLMRYDQLDDTRVWRNKPEHMKKILANNFVENSRGANGYIKKLMVEDLDVAYECSNCNIDEWDGKPISLDLDHINGTNTDNRIENLRLLCPNCHSQTDNFCGKNMNNGKKKVSDEDFIKALNENKTIRQALLDVGLTPKGANYERAHKLKNQLKQCFKDAGESFQEQP